MYLMINTYVHTSEDVLWKVVELLSLDVVLTLGKILIGTWKDSVHIAG